MSAKIEIVRDKDGFLNCKFCPRIFLTNILFENHLSSQHKKNTETKPDIHHFQELQTKPDESSIQKNIQFQKCSLANIVHKKLTPYQCQECKKSFGYKQILQSHIDAVHKKLTPYKCRECNKSFGSKQLLTRHINTVHKK